MVKCGNHSEATYHESVQEVRACYGAQAINRINTKQTATAERDYPIATLPQRRFIERLLNDRVSPDDDDVTWSIKLQESLGNEHQEWNNGLLRPCTLGLRDASAAITRLKGWSKAPKEVPPFTSAYERTEQDRLLGGFVPSSVAEAAQAFGVKPQPTVTQDGMYRNPQTGEIFKVQFNRASGSGQRLYAKQLMLTRPSSEVAFRIEEVREIPLVGPIRNDESIGWAAEFVYAPGAIATLRPEWRMTMAEARQFGALYGNCVRCGRDLTAEDSIERMMGPACAKKGNWA